MNIPVSMGHMNALPFGNNRHVTKCCLCGDFLELPGEYPMLVIRSNPKANVFMGDENGNPIVVQTGVKIYKPLCRRHLDDMSDAEQDALYDLLEGTSLAKEKAGA